MSLGLERSVVNADRVSIVELGFGTMPYILHAPSVDFDRVSYIGVEPAVLAGESEGLTADVFAQASSDLGNVAELEFRLLSASADNLPLPDCSVDIVHMANVMGDIAIADEKKELFMKEIARVLREGGILRVVENMTPEIFPLERLILLAKSCNLTQINNGREHERQEIRRFVHPRSLVLPHHYLAIFAPAPR